MIGSSHRRRAKSPLGTVLIINLLRKGLTPRACMGDGGSYFLARCVEVSWSNKIAKACRECESYPLLKQNDNRFLRVFFFISACIKVGMSIEKQKTVKRFTKEIKFEVKC